jgi:hypothetical protein
VVEGSCYTFPTLLFFGTTQASLRLTCMACTCFYQDLSRNQALLGEWFALISELDLVARVSPPPPHTHTHWCNPPQPLLSCTTTTARWTQCGTSMFELAPPIRAPVHTLPPLSVLSRILRWTVPPPPSHNPFSLFALACRPRLGWMPLGGGQQKMRLTWSGGSGRNPFKGVGTVLG